MKKHWRIILIISIVILFLIASPVLFISGLSLFKFIDEKTCSFRKGEWIVAGGGIAGGYYKCFTSKYKDGGKKCQSSSDCEGKCIIGTNMLIKPDGSYNRINHPDCHELKVSYYYQYDCSTLNLVGQCEKWPINDDQIEYMFFENGIVIPFPYNHEH